VKTISKRDVGLADSSVEYNISNNLLYQEMESLILTQSVQLQLLHRVPYKRVCDFQTDNLEIGTVEGE